jgi:hypothetical protein
MAIKTQHMKRYGMQKKQYSVEQISCFLEVKNFPIIKIPGINISLKNSTKYLKKS